MNKKRLEPRRLAYPADPTRPERDAARGFRTVSGGILRPLEDRRDARAFNRWLGARFSAACVEVRIVLEKPREDRVA
jgi:hypothetical protein